MLIQPTLTCSRRNIRCVRIPPRFLDELYLANQGVKIAVEMREEIGELTEKWKRLGHELGIGIGIAHGYATLGTIGFEGRFDYAAIGTVSNMPRGCAMKRYPSKS